MSTWNSIFRADKNVLQEPIPEMKKVIKLMKKSGVKKVLDLGCGSGRHTVLLAKEGFEVYGLDNAPEGLMIVRKKLKDLGLKAKLKNADCYKKLPYENDFFDAVISTAVIQHNYHDKILFCISEIQRVLKPGGIVFVTVASKRRLERGYLKHPESRPKEVAPMTFIPVNGPEKGIVHFIYTKELLKRDFRDFEIMEICKDSEKKKCCLLGKTKK